MITTIEALPAAGLHPDADANKVRDARAEWLKLDAADGGALAFAYRHGQVMERRDRGGKISLRLRVHPDEMGRFEQRFDSKSLTKQGLGHDR